MRFGREVCGELAAAERREWLVTNGLGGFASGTIAGTLTRRYHGLLLAALHPPVGRTLLVTKIDEVATYDGTAYELGANRWKDDAVSPQGFATIESFELDGTTPVWRYALADSLLEKRIWMEQGSNATYVRYGNVRGRSPIGLALRVFVNDRDFHGNTHAGDRHIDVRAVDGGMRVDPLRDGSSPFTILADRAACTIENVWYRDFVLSQETARGLDDRDDNLAAGSFDVSLAPGQSLTIVAYADAHPPHVDVDGAPARRRAHERAVLDAWQRMPGAAGAPPWMAQCVLAADQFVVARPLKDDPDALSIVAGYHWFGDWSRDTTIALPGLALATGRPAIARRILLTFARFVDGGMLPNYFPDGGQAPEYNAVDAPLWYVEAVARYVDATGDVATLQALAPALGSIVAAYRDGTRYGIHIDPDDGLVVAGVPGVQLTWMDAKIGDWVVTPRMGKPIEISALWYNALQRMVVFASLLERSPAEYAKLAAAVRFDRFWNAAAGYCYDVLDSPNGDDPACRPNQLFAASLPYRALEPERCRAVVDACAARLLTSNGMRTLAPGEPGYAPHYGGSPHDRDAAYHQGTAWPWLLGAFAVAHARAYGNAALARSFLEPLADQLGDYGLGTISELADASRPFASCGAIAQAWSVAELLRAWKDVESAAKAGSGSPVRQ